MLLGCDEEAARVAMERVRARVAATPAHWEGRLLPVAISIGVASTNPEGLTATGLAYAADEARYCAKAGGRNRVEVAGSWQPIVVEGSVPLVAA